MNIEQKYLNVSRNLNEYTSIKLTNELNSIIKTHNKNGYKIINISSVIYNFLDNPIISYDILMEKINE